MDEGSSRIVVLAPNWLGDAVMALPAIRDVRRHLSGAQFTIAARPSVAPLFHAVPGVDDILMLKAEGTQAALRKNVAILRERRFDLGILLPNSFRSALMLWRAGVKERWGYRSDFRGPLLTKSVRRPKRKVHFGEYYQHLVRELGIETGPLTPQLKAPQPKIGAAAQLLRDRGWSAGQTLVAMAAGAAFGHAKRWPAERFAALAKSLRDDLGAACVLVGLNEDRDAARQIEGINLVGQTDLLLLMGVLSHCRALVANDSGALHLAAALGVPVAGIYGPTDERYSSPLPSIEGGENRVAVLSEQVFCRPCFLRDCPIDHRCMKRIPAERVYTSVRQLLDLLQRESHA